MNIEIIKLEVEESNLVKLSKYLLTELANIKLCHFFTDSYNAHQIFDKIYKKLEKSVDSLIEELIQMEKCENSIELFETNLNLNLENFTHESESFFIFEKICLDLKENLKIILNEDFLNSLPPNGIKNTLDEIYNALNKAHYLLGMCGKNFTPSLKQLGLNSLDSSTQELTIGNLSDQTF